MDRSPPPSQWQRTSLVTASLLAFTLVGVILYVGKEVLVPVALGTLLTFLLGPLVTRLDQRGSPRIVSVIVVVAGTGLLLLGLILFVGYQLSGLATDLEKYRPNIKQKVAQLRELSKGGFFEQVSTTVNEVSEEMKKKDEEGKKKPKEASPSAKDPVPVTVVRETPSDQALQGALSPLMALVPLINPLATVGISLVLAVFMLIKREDLRNRVVRFTNLGGLTTTTRALDDAARRISRYLLMQLVINGTFGVAVGVGLLILQVPYALLWGLCAGVLRYIPYLGPWIAAVLPLGMSLIVTPGWALFFAVLALFAVLELVSNNVMEPWLYGQGTGVSEVAILVSAIFWAWIWGPMGLILAAPLTVCLVVLGKYVPSLAFLDQLLGDTPVLAPHEAFLQRLLAHDPREAQVIAAAARKDGAPVAVFDEVIVPALILAKEERARGVMSPEDEALILESAREIAGGLESVAASPGGAPGANGAAPPPSPAAPEVPGFRMLGCPAHHEMDELALEMLACVARDVGAEAQVLSTKSLPSEVLAEVKKRKPAVICIAAVPPGGLVQAYYLCRRLRKGSPTSEIIVAYLGYQRGLDRIIAKMRGAGANYVTTTLAGARNHVVNAMTKLARSGGRAAPATPRPAAQPAPPPVPTP